MQIAIGTQIGYQAGAGGAAGIFDYLINDTFTTARSAGAIESTPAEPGPGVRTVNDTNSKLSISGGNLVIAAGTSSSWINPACYWSPLISPAVGRMIRYSWTATSNRIRLSLVADKTQQPFWSAYGAFGSFSWRTGASIDVYAFSLSTAYLTIILIGQQGAYLMHKISGNWQLLWIFDASVDVGSVPTFYPMVSTFDSTATVADVSVPALRWLPTPVVSDGFGSWGTTDGLGHAEGVADVLGAGGNDIGWAEDYGDWAVSSGRAYASTIDGGAGVSIATLDSGDTDYMISCDLYSLAGTATSIIARWVDIDNHIVIRHTGSAVQLIKVVAGSATTLINAANTYVEGARLRLIVAGTKFRAYYNNAAIGSETTIADAAVQSSTEVGLIADNTATRFDNFVVYARGSGGEYDSVLDNI